MSHFTRLCATLLAFGAFTSVPMHATPAGTSPAPMFPALQNDPLYDRETLQALRDVVIDVSWKDVEVGRAARDLSLAVRSARPIAADLNFFISSTAAADFRHRHVTILLKRVPVLDVLGYMASQAGFTVKVHPGVVLLVPRAVSPPTPAGKETP